MYYSKYISEAFVKMFIVEQNKKIVFIGRNIEGMKFNNLIESETNLIKDVKRQLDEYFCGQRRDFNIPVSFVSGTEFQKNVWLGISKIPYGKTFSYSELADSISTKALRAVGTACSKNPLAIVIPCHRVIKSDGTYGNYVFGENYKSQLLKLENIQTPTIQK